MSATLNNGQRIDRKAIWGWMCFDWAAQPYHTLVVTFIFAPYFVTVIAPDPVTGQIWWSYAVAVGGIIIGLTAPLLGSLSDAVGPKKPWVFGFSIIGILGASMLWYAEPGVGSSSIYMGLAGYIIAAIGFEFATVFNNAMMPHLVPRNQLGALSGNAMALGFVGGLICLLFVLLFVVVNPASGKTFLMIDPILGLNSQFYEGERAMGPISAMWYVVFLVPFFLFAIDTQRKAAHPNVFRSSITDLYTTIRSLPENTSLFGFLGASMLYRDAFGGLIVFGGIYSAGVMGWNSVDLGIFGISTYIALFLGSLLAGIIDNRIGTKNVVVMSIWLLILACMIIISIAPGELFFTKLAASSSLPDLAFYASGCLIGVAGGALQASSRPLLSDQMKLEKMGEAFGLYAFSGKATAFLAPLLIAIITGVFQNQRVGIIPIVFLFIASLFLMIPVRSKG